MVKVRLYGALIAHRSMSTYAFEVKVRLETGIIDYHGWLKMKIENV